MKYEEIISLAAFSLFVCGEKVWRISLFMNHALNSLQIQIFSFADPA
jgi:hypothetical protein